MIPKQRTTVNLIGGKGMGKVVSYVLDVYVPAKYEFRFNSTEINGPRELSLCNLDRLVFRMMFSYGMQKNGKKIK